MTPPPFATYLPDAAYVKQPNPVPRQRQRKEDDHTGPGGVRESAYAAFDTYFTGNESDNRASGVGNIGRGLMSADSDSDDSDDEQRTTATTKTSDKHRMLYEAATGPTNSALSGRPVAHSTPKNVPHSQTGHLRVVKQQPQNLDLARGKDWSASHRIEPTTPPGISTPRAMSTEPKGPPTPIPAAQLPLASPSPAHIRPIQPAFMQGHTTPNPFMGAMPGTPTTRTPQPLPPPQTPITPVFARPVKESAIKFSQDVLRGDSEETLLPRGRGGKGDDFWRRFSMVAHEEEKAGSSKSAWLRKTENGTTRLATWVWCVGIIILVAIGGSVGLGWYFTHNKPAKQPVAIGGSAGETGIAETASSLSVEPTSIRPTKVTAAPVPTDASTNDKRYFDELIPRVPEYSSPWPHNQRRSFSSRNLH